MEFCKFAHKMKGIIGKNYTNAGAFTRNLFEHITEVPNDVSPNPFVETHDSTFKSYYTGDRKLTRFSQKIIPYVNAEKFADYLSGLENDPLDLLYQEFKSDCPHMTKQSVADEIASLFRDIIFSFAKKNLSPKKKKEIINTVNDENEEISSEDFPLLNECNMRCPLCNAPLVRNIKGKYVKKYIVVQMKPSWLDLFRSLEFDKVAAAPANTDSLDNEICLCDDCAIEYNADPTPEEYRKLLETKKSLNLELSLRNKRNEVEIEKGISEILSKLSEIKTPPKPSDKTKWKAFRVDRKIPYDNFNLQSRVTYWVLHYYRYLEQQFGQMERSSNLRFRKVQNEVSQMFETFDEMDLSQPEIFEQMIKWLEEQTGCHDRDPLEVVISFFIQNCEVFNETAE